MTRKILIILPHLFSLLLLLFIVTSSSSSSSGVAGIMMSPRTKVIGTLEFQMHQNPGYLRVRPAYIAPSRFPTNLNYNDNNQTKHNNNNNSTNNMNDDGNNYYEYDQTTTPPPETANPIPSTMIMTTTSSSPPPTSSSSITTAPPSSPTPPGTNHDDDGIENQKNISFGGVCSFLLDPLNSLFIIEEQYAQAQKVANLFCGWLYDFSDPNSTHTNYFYTETTNTTQDPKPKEAYLRNVICPNQFVCNSEDIFSPDYTFNRSEEYFSTCQYEFFYRSPSLFVGSTTTTTTTVSSLPCFGNNIAGLHCIADRSTSPSFNPLVPSTTTTSFPPFLTTASAATTSASSSPTQQQKVLQKYEKVYSSEGLRIGTEWIARLNRSANNRLEVKRVVVAAASNGSNDNSSRSDWGVVCDTTWNNDIARLWCNEFFGFTSKRATVFLANDPQSQPFNPNALKDAGYNFTWGPAPRCSGCCNGSLDAGCEVFTFTGNCQVGEEIGLSCENLELPADEDGGETTAPTIAIATSTSTNASSFPNNNNTTTTSSPSNNNEPKLLILSAVNGGYEWRLNESRGGLVEVRPIKNMSRASSLPWGFIKFTSDDTITSDTICQWFGRSRGGYTRTPLDIEENFTSSIPPLDLQPCYLSWIKCFSRSAVSLSQCIFNTNNAEHCGGARNAQYLVCLPNPDPPPERTQSETFSVSESMSFSESNTTPFIATNPSTPAPTTPAPPPRDPGGLLDFSGGAGLTRGGTAAIGVGLGIGFAFLTVIVIFLIFAFRNKEIVVDCLEGIRSAEEYEIEDEKEDQRAAEQLKEEQKYRTTDPIDDDEFVMEMTPLHSNDFDSFPIPPPISLNAEKKATMMKSRKKNNNQGEKRNDTNNIPKKRQNDYKSSDVIQDDQFTPRNEDNNGDDDDGGR